MKNYSILVTLNITVIFLILVSCSDQSTGAEEEISEKGEGIINISGAFESQHEGVSWYVGLQIGEDGGYANYTMNISDVPPGETQQGSFSFSIRMAGDGGPFNLSTGEYKDGEVDKGVLSISSYTNREGTNSRSYSSTSDTEGTFTIRSISDTSVEASFDLQLEAGPSTEDGFITVTGTLIANCLTLQAGGVGC